MPDNRPIGVFDSGVGGLTVLRALQDALPHESTVYLGDLARCPYGVRPQRDVREFTLQAAAALAHQGIKLLVVACNTATAAGYHALRSSCDFPVVGVIDPGAQAAVHLSRTGTIAVAATDGTVRSGAYRSSILAAQPGAIVIEHALSWLVPLIESGQAGGEDTVVRLAPSLGRLHEGGVDVLILGCTHFPLIADIFERAVGPPVTVVDSATATAREVGSVLKGLGLEGSGPPVHRFLVTGPAEAFLRRAATMFGSVPPLETVILALDPVA